MNSITRSGRIHMQLSRKYVPDRNYRITSSAIEESNAIAVWSAVLEN